MVSLSATVSLLSLLFRSESAITIQQVYFINTIILVMSKAAHAAAALDLLVEISSVIYNIMSRQQKFKVAKKSSESLSALQHHLFQQLDTINNKTEYCLNPDSLFAEFQEYQDPTNQIPAPKMTLLTKAKQLTYSNKGKIQRMRREIKRLQQGEGAEFITGVGLFESREPLHQPFEEPDQTALLQSLKQRGKGDDLQELRRMIKKTENNLKMYSHSIYNTQKEVVSAAEKCGRDLDVGLAIKINRCNLDMEFSQAATKNIEQIRRRTFSSQNPRRNYKH